MSDRSRLPPHLPDRRAVLRALSGWAGWAAWATLGSVPSALLAAGTGGGELRIFVSGLGEASGQIGAALTKRFPNAQVSDDLKVLTARRDRKSVV